MAKPSSREAQGPPGAPDEAALAALTPREREVCRLLLQGKKQREVAAQLCVRPATISFHTQSLYRKLGIHDRAQLFIRYAQPGSKAIEEGSTNEGEEE